MKRLTRLVLLLLACCALFGFLAPAFATDFAQFQNYPPQSAQFVNNGYGAAGFQQFGANPYAGNAQQIGQNLAYGNLNFKQQAFKQQAFKQQAFAYSQRQQAQRAALNAHFAQQDARLAVAQARQAQAFANQQRRQAINANRNLLGRIVTAPFRAVAAVFD